MGTFLKALTIYPKLVLSFLLMIIPIYLSSLLMNQSGHDVVKKQISASMASRVHFYLSSLETELARLRRLQMEYVSDDDLLSLGTAVSRMNDFERSRTILSVKSKLYLLKSSSPFVENVKLYVPALGRSIMANNYDDAIPEAELEAMLEPRNMSSPVFGFRDRLLLSGVYPDAIYVNRQPVLAIEIELSKAEIVRTLSSMANGEQGGAVWLSADGTWDVASGLQPTVLSELTGAIRTKRADDRAAAPGQFTMKTEAGSFFVAHEYSSVIDSTLAVLVPAEKVMQPLNRHRDWIWLLSLIALVLVVVFSYWIHQLIHKPIKRLVVSFRKVEKGDLGVRVYHRNQDEFHYLYNQFNHMLGRIETLIGEVYEQQIRSQRSELKQLQSQINPHFFYNSFFILQGLVQMREHELADKMFRHLGSYFQFITRNGAETVTLEQEMKHASSYVEIQKFRFSGTIEVEQEELPAEWAQTQVPRLIVQPLIENAYLHGLENKTGDGRLRIGFREEPDGRLRIEIEDNGEELDELRLERLRESISAADRAIETTGLLNIHRRLQLKFGPDCGLSLSRSALGGLKAELSIRKDKGEAA
ncbi:sensor histidine kinase [Cohnella hashimotonis]|uniref:Histidine kinase n=1 Tax=Cohnella hashimotonis TaxID=2826895 RepID=A0ABT6TNH7_9BACL|nr:histidine kinase [Cohnella hashimotonis]MDI4648408.1 histidine kinase [Cohnella hashimotonis]